MTIIDGSLSIDEFDVDVDSLGGIECGSFETFSTSQAMSETALQTVASLFGDENVRGLER